ncbi:DNA polymerase III subunit delta [Pelagibius sp. CAU 1746]|uniref:DNA polymerase III subunit delta n=1 Tax=Pelagibius sp. CAU 1746 TaxID=3140370 RepID=UPI00325C2087
MKLNAKQAESFVRSPDPAVRAVLLYGPDAGLRRERSAALLAKIVDDPADPFAVSELTGAQLAEDPARLADEAAALVFGGGRRFVRVRDAGDKATATVKDFLSGSPGDAFVVIEADDLPARSTLRKLFESDKAAAALACYHDDSRSLEAVVRSFFADAGLAIGRDAVAFLSAHLGGDRELTRRELEKVLLFKGAGTGEVTLQDVEICVGDSALLSLDDVALATGAGNLPALERAVARSFTEGNSPISLLRAAARHFQRIHAVAGAGGAVDDAMKRLRPPVFWKTAAAFKAQAEAWRPAQLARALERLLEAEAACKRTGAPAETLASRALLEIAANAPGRRRRAG